jgi:hypothetical protein
MSHKTHMNGDRELHSGVVPAKRSNESLGGPREIVEARPLTKENAGKPNPNRVRSRESRAKRLDRAHQAAKEDPKDAVHRPAAPKAS